jgi:hypothetical protein
VKVVSIALFGTGDSYAQYLPAFTRAHLNLFPIEQGWQLHVNLCSDVDEKWKRFLAALSSEGLVVVRPREPVELTAAMLWRMHPVFDKNAGYVFCRDLDALPLPRDRRICEDFMLSGCDVHTAHDNIHHTGVMGGLCAFRAQSFREVMCWNSLQDIFEAARNAPWAQKGTDQIVLNQLVAAHPHIKLLEHRFGGWTQGRPTSARRPEGRYACQSWSIPMPDVGISGFSPELAAQADRLAGHLGAAGYDHVAASAWYDEHGGANVTAMVKRCAKVAGL